MGESGLMISEHELFLGMNFIAGCFTGFITCLALVRFYWEKVKIDLKRMVED